MPSPLPLQTVAWSDAWGQALYYQCPLCPRCWFSGFQPRPSHSHTVQLSSNAGWLPGWVCTFTTGSYSPLSCDFYSIPELCALFSLLFPPSSLYRIWLLCLDSQISVQHDFNIALLSLSTLRTHLSAYPSLIKIRLELSETWQNQLWDLC